MSAVSWNLSCGVLRGLTLSNGSGLLGYVMDKGFYSKQNLDELAASGDKFLLAVPLNNKWLHKAIDDVYDTIHSPEGYHKLDDEILYLHTPGFILGASRDIAVTCIFTIMQKPEQSL